MSDASKRRNTWHLSIRRLWTRRWSSFLGLATLVVLVGSASGLGASARLTIDSTIDENFRGAFDLLIRPASASAPAASELVERDFLGRAPTEGISTRMLQRVRGLPGVDVAAPIGVVGLLESTTAAPLIRVFDPPSTETLFRIRVTGTADDGVRPVQVYSSTVHAVLGPSANPDIRVAAMSDSRSGESMDEWSTLIGLDPLGGVQELVIAVDPAAEAALLGAGGEDLLALERYRDAARPATLGEFQFDDLEERYRLTAAYLAGVSQMAQRGGLDQMNARPLVPMIVADSRYQDLVLTATIEPAVAPANAMPSGLGDLGALVRDANWSDPLVPIVLDAGDRFVPFQNPSLELVWPEQQRPAAGDDRGVYSGATDTTLRPTFIGPAVFPDSAMVFDGLPSYVAEPVGRKTWATSSALASEVGAVATEPLYRSTSEAPSDIVTTFVSQNPYDRPFFPVPVGTFNLATLQPRSDTLNYVPFGAYDEPDARLVKPADPRRDQPTAMHPTFAHAGLLPAPPVAITDLAAAELLRGADPIDAIRVRLDDSFDYSPAGREAIEAIASEIENMGLRVDIVAGSSPQDVAIEVRGYYPDDDETSLGWVQQPWTTVGAATRVNRTLTGVTTALAITALVGSAVFAFVINDAQKQRLTADAELLVLTGWQRRDIEQWLLTGTRQVVIAAAVLALVGWRSWGARDMFGLVSALSCVAVWMGVARLYAAATAGRAIRNARLEPQQHRSVQLRLPVPARTPTGYALRSIIRRPMTSAILLGCLTASAISSGVAAAMLVSGRGASGATRLAEAARSSTGTAGIATVLAVAAAGIVVAQLVSWLDLTNRDSEFVALLASGWSSTKLSSTVAGSVALISAVALALSLAAVGGVSRVAGTSAATPTLAAFASVVVSGTAIAVAAHARVHHRHD